MAKKVNVQKGVEMDSKEFLERLTEEIGDADMVQLPVKSENDAITDRNVVFGLRSNTDEQKANWEALKDAMEGAYADRFMQILDDLAVSKPKEFIRVYLKALEHFKPKLIRTDGRNLEDRDKKIEIIIKE